MNKTSDNFKAMTGAKPRKSRAKATNYEEKSGAPACPRSLSAEARAEWVRVVAMLRARRVLTKADSVTLEIYVNAVIRYRAAQLSIERDGVLVLVTTLDSNGTARDVRRLNPALKVLESCERTLKSFAREIGSTPRSRTQVKPAQETEQKAAPEDRVQRKADEILKRLNE